MMVYSSDGQTVFLKGTKVWFEVLGRQVSFIRNAGKWYLRLPHDLYTDTHQAAVHQLQIAINEKYGDRNLSLYFSQYDTGYFSYHKYRYAERVTIGSSIDDDIYVQDINMQEYVLLCDDGKLRLLKGSETIMEPVNGSRFQYLNLCIVFHSDFIMVNRPSNIYVSLEAYTIPEPAGRLPQLQKQIVRPMYRNPVFTDELHTTLREPLQAEVFRRMPLIFSVGPALTMSSAALLVGSISVYRGWMNGRQIMDMLPMVLLPAVMVISAIVWTPLQRIYERAKEKKQLRRRQEDYSQYIEARYQEADEFMHEYSNLVQLLFPDLHTLPDTAPYQRMPFHRDWLTVRLGHGIHEFRVDYEMRFRIEKEDSLYPVLQRLLDHTSMDTLFLLNLTEHHKYAVLSESTALYILVQLCWFHSPAELKICIAADEKWFNDHRYVYHIPHVMLGREGSGLRLFACDDSGLQTLINELDGRKETCILFAFGDSVDAAAFPGITINCVNEEQIPYKTEVVVNGSGRVSCEADQACFVPDQAGEKEMLQVLSQLNRYGIQGNDHLLLSAAPSFFDLYGIGTASEAMIEQHWHSNRAKDAVRAVIGLQENGKPLMLDLHEKAQGPHGLIAGMTGSGKSELIISLVLSLAVSYSPRELQFAMIDFKGGGAAGMLTHGQYRLPHISSVLTDLDDSIIERALVSFQNECRRREELFTSLGEYHQTAVMDIHQYQEVWDQDCGLPYLSELVIIVDEFAELKKNHPDFMKDLITLARVGRSLGVHLILATQKPAGIVDEQIWSNSRFKLCLRVQDKQDSMEVLHDECASKLRNPGSFYLLCDGTLKKGCSGYTGVPASRNSCTVSLLSLQAQRIRTVHGEDKVSESQLNAVLKEIHSVYVQGQYDVYPLWLPPLHSVLPGQINRSQHVLALIDDYRNNRRKELILKPYTSVFIDSLNREEKHSFLADVLSTVLSGSAEQVVIINDSLPEINAWEEKGRLSGVFPSTDAYRMQWFADDVDSSRAHSTAVVITDISVFLETDKNTKYLNHWLENTEMLQMTLIVFASSAQSIPFRMLSLFRMRLSLQNENRQDLSLLFEKNADQTVKEERHGIVREDDLMLFCWPDTEMPDPSALPGNHYRVPSIPDHYVPDDSDIVGLRMKDCTGLRLRPRTIIVYDSNLSAERMKDRLIRAGRTVESMDSVPAVFDLILMDENTFRSIPASVLPDILYCGERYRSYYTLPVLREEIPDQCGVYIHDGKAEVILLAEYD